MKPKILLLLVCSFFFRFANLHAQLIRFQELPTQNALPTVYANKVMIDSEGFAWYGTEGYGLCRDNGYTVHVFRSDYLSKSVMHNNYITCITEDKKNRKIYFGTKRGLYILDKKDYSIHLFADKSITNWSIDDLLLTREGELWIATNNSVLHYNKRGKLLSRYHSLYQGYEKPVHYLYEDRNGEVWALQRNGQPLLFRGNIMTPVKWPFKDGPASVVDIPHTKQQWICVNGKGLYCVDALKGEYKQVVLSDHTTGFIKVIPDKTHQLIWAMTPTHVYAYNMLRPDKLQALPGIKQPEFLQLRDMALDNNGKVWVMSNYPYSMICYADHSGYERYTLPLLPTSDTRIASPVAICAKGNNILFCQQRKGLYGFQKNTNKLTKYDKNNGFFDGKVSSFIEHTVDYRHFYTVVNNTKVVSMTFDGQGRIHSTSLTETPKGHYIHVLRYGKDDILWIGTTNGLYGCNIRTKKLSKLQTQFGSINAIICNKGELLLGTEKKGLCIYNPQKRFSRIYTPRENVTKITISHNGKIWWATNSGNLYQLEKTPTSMAEEIGLKGEPILGLQNDSSGKIWILTGKRLNIYDEKSHAMTTVNGNDCTLQLNNMLCINQAAEGHMVIGGQGGLCMLSDIRKKRADNPTRLLLSSWESNDSIHITGYGTHKIHLEANQRDVELFFSSLEHLYASEVRIAYRYKGSEKWNYLPAGQNSIRLIGLSRGDHDIELHCTNADGMWCKDMLNIHVYREPTWYESNIAFTGYLLFAITVLLLTIRYYTNRKRQKIAEEQLQNSAKDIRELFSQLSEDSLVADGNDRMDILSLLSNIKEMLRQQKRNENKELSDNTEKEYNKEGKKLSDADEQFVNKALECIERNINNNDYSVEQLSADLAMERTGLYRKLMNIIGKTPTNFIRATRLRRAASLLDQGHSVNEAATLSGFGTTNYMSRCFQKEFGMKPSEYLKRKKDDKL